MSLRSLRLFLPLFLLLHADAGLLQYHYYDSSCPKVEEIVYNEAATLVANDPTLAAAFLRMHFHDCFVLGCDASVLLNASPPFKAEKDADPNASLRGFAEIDSVKAAVEEQCPGVVSCADILAILARDSVALRGGKRYEVELGRRDGIISLDIAALLHLPPPNLDINLLILLFATKGLSPKDVAVLSGAHTIGQAHCSSFQNRLHNFSITSDVDPSLDGAYAQELSSKCAGSNAANTRVDMDFLTSTTFDANYYELVKEHKGLLGTDAALLNSPFTSPYVQNYYTQPSSFLDDFAESMVKMGRIQPLIGIFGQIRKTCSKVNS